MPRSINILSLLLIWNSLCLAQNYGSKSEGIARISQFHQDAFSTVNNPSGLAKIENFSSASYYSSPFLLKALNQQSIGIAIPTNTLVHGFSYSQTGQSNYREIQGNYAMAKVLSEKLSLGIYMGFRRLQLEEVYGQRDQILAGLSTHIQCNEKNSFAFAIHNPHRPSLASYQNEIIPSKAIFAYINQFSKLGSFIIESELNWENKGILRLGLEQKLSKDFEFRIGWASTQELFSFGLSVSKKQMEIAASYAYHNMLGYIPSLSLYYISKRNE